MPPCPHCRSSHVTRKSFYIRASDHKEIKRFKCQDCRKSFSEQTLRADYRLRKRSINTVCIRLLCQGMSQRAVARTLGVKQEAVAIRVVRFGRSSEAQLADYRRKRAKIKTVILDEMESFEHSKCKPLTMPIAVEDKTRKIIALDVGAIAAKGRLAAISRKKYGLRKCQRSEALKQVLDGLKTCCDDGVVIKSDLSPHYPSKIKKLFPKATHQPFKGRRGCVVGQGELKAGGFDPLFTLNHTYAMFRCGLKRLTRRTWCTTKLPHRLRNIMHLYAWFHNCRLDLVGKLPSAKHFMMVPS